MRSVLHPLGPKRNHDLVLTSGVASGDPRTAEPHPAGWLRRLAGALREPIVVLDPSRRIVFANPAACELLDEDEETLYNEPITKVLGSDPTAPRSPSSARMREGGLDWTPVRRPAPGASGRLAAAAISTPAVVTRPDATAEPDSAASGFLVLLRDVASVAEADLARLDADRVALLTLMDQVRPADDLQGTVAGLCRALERLDWIGGAMIFLTPGTHQMINVTADVPEELGLPFGAELSLAQLDRLLTATYDGPWCLDIGAGEAREFIESELLDAMAALGIKASAYAPIRSDDNLLGVLAVASMVDDGFLVLARRLGSLEDLAHMAGAVLRNQAVHFSRLSRLRSSITACIESAAYRTVFQPIVHLSDGAVEYYEALTRFGDGRAPDEHFADAREADLEIALEEACARTALASCAGLPAGLPIGLNLSPDAILDGVLLRLGQTDRRIVVEITEHAATGSYELLRAALRRTPSASLAVDDAGAGFASLRHILELQPALVKLDIHLVRHIDSDPARAAMVAGMCHFAASTGTRLIAEGVETEEQARTLRGLGVELAQGYLFGRPAPPTAITPSGAAD